MYKLSNILYLNNWLRTQSLAGPNKLQGSQGAAPPPLHRRSWKGERED